MYEYRCRVTDIYDGDTLTLEVDLGFKIVHEIRVRLLNIDTPEVRGPERVEGLAAKSFVVDWVNSHDGSTAEWPFIVRTEKTGKYGRWLADIMPVAAGSRLSLVQAIKMEGFDTGDWQNWS